MSAAATPDTLASEAAYPDHTGHYRGRFGSPMRTRNGTTALVRHRHTMRDPDPDSLSVTEVAAGLGMPHATVLHWVTLGWLKAGWVGYAKGRKGARYAIEVDDVLDFLADPRSFPYVRPDLIADPDWRAFAAYERDASEWAPPAEAARRHGHEPRTIRTLYLRGHIRHLRFRHSWRVVYSLTDLAAYVARQTPPARGKAGKGGR